MGGGGGGVVTLSPGAEEQVWLVPQAGSPSRSSSSGAQCGFTAMPVTQPPLMTQAPSTHRDHSHGHCDIVSRNLPPSVHVEARALVTTVSTGQATVWDAVASLHKKVTIKEDQTGTKMWAKCHIRRGGWHGGWGPAAMSGVLTFTLSSLAFHHVSSWDVQGYSWYPALIVNYSWWYLSSAWLPDCRVPPPRAAM